MTASFARRPGTADTILVALAAALLAVPGRADRTRAAPSDADPDLEAGFPVKALHLPGTYHGGPALHALVGNIDADPDLEILVSGLGTGPLYAWKHDGSLARGWPISRLDGVGYMVLGEFVPDRP